MGAWGLGPFDSDGALDFLGDLAHRHATMKDDDGYEIDPSSVRHDAVHAALLEALTAVTRPAAEGEYRWGTVDDAYASAGLVAAALTGQHTDSPKGTSLFEQTRGLNLDRHCGYVDLLPTDRAVPLLPQAIAAVSAISTESDWVDHWNDPDSIREMLTDLLAVLREHAPAAST